MGRRFAQVMGVLLIVANICSARGPYAEQLRSECRQLIADAVEKPYGLGWSQTPAASKSGSAARPVMMDPGYSPAAGLVLLYAGELLNEPAFTDAARSAARGVMAAQSSTGQIAPVALFGDTPDAKPAEQPLPDRASARAGLALLLAVLDSHLNKDPSMLESADRASRWLRKQQDNGAWVRESGGEKLIQFDDADFRDSTLVLLLEEQSLDKPDARQAVERAMSRLNSLQLGGMSEFLPGARLWTTRYTAAGDAVSAAGRPKETADLLATRYAMQLLLATAVCWGQRGTVGELDRSAHRVATLRRPDGGWRRFEAIAAPPVDGPVGEFGLPATLNAAKSLKNLGPDRYRQLLSAGWSPEQHLAIVVAGLSDQLMLLDWPVAAGEVEPYVLARASDWAVLQGPAPDDLPQRVLRLWVLLQRAKLERQQQP